MNCPKCLDTGWIGYVPGHKNYPTDWFPCQECNKDQHIPSPFLGNTTYEIVTDSGTSSLWKEGMTCPHCTDSILVRAESGNGVKCPSCGYEITWTP